MLTLLFAGCQSTGGAAAPATPERTPDEITFSSDADMVCALLRQAGPMIGTGGIVIMNGAGRDIVSGQKFKGLSATAFAEKLASAGGLKIAATPHYTFLYPEGYEVLPETRFAFSGALAPMEATAIFGDGTRMYNALAILSQSLGVSIVADNIVADILCGEVVIRDAPLSTVIEALLRSARATADAVVVEATDEYIFLRATGNNSPTDALLVSGALTAQQSALLANRVDIFLPAAAKRPGTAVFVQEAMTLGKALGTLERQLGVPVRAEDALLSLPVNYTVLNGVTVHAALNLIVRQWPMDRFGFTIGDDGITLRAR